MASGGIAFLMYHELGLPERAPCRPDRGYTRYVVPASDFRAQMERLAGEGWHGRSVTQAMESFGDKCVCITFDDGCETDLISAAPLLKRLGFGATSYITVDYLNKPGYLSHAQLRELHAMGFEIGCHSLTHPYLTDIDNDQLRQETAGAKDRLEHIIGARVDHFACPGGAWNARVAQAVTHAGFRTMATSRTAVNFPATDPFALSRVAIFNGMSSDEIAAICRGQGLRGTRVKQAVRDYARRVLGNTLYVSLRGLIVRDKV